MKKLIRKNFIIIIIIFLLGISLTFWFIFRSPYKFTGNGPIKIFWLNSYNSDFPLVTENIKAFKEIFKKEGIEIEIKEFDLDELRDTSKEHQVTVTQEAIKLIDEYKPNLIYATDDPSQEVISKYVNTHTPIVFSGVNQDPQTYGYDKSKNVAGVLEREHFAETIDFLKSLYPNKITTIGVISQDLPQWKPVMDRIRQQTDMFPKIQFIGWSMVHTFEDYKKKILEYQDLKVDAIMNFSIVGLVDEKNNNVPETEVTKWLVKNSHIPETTFWGFIVEDGALLSVEVSSEEQGKNAGIIAKSILVDGKFPISFSFKPTEKGLRYLNLARAKSLGLSQKDISSTILINSKIIKKFPWEN